MSPVARIAVFGTESTGKSVLAEALARHHGEPWAPEYVREFWMARAGRIRGADLAAIARGQVAAEEEAASRTRRVVFCDTELLTNVLWADLLFPGCCPAWVREEAEVRARGYTLYLLCAADLPWSDDPQRCFPDAVARARHARRWRAELVRRGLPFVEITGEGEARVARAVAAVAAILETGGS
jgi:HTH-type transcriptional regulator, transcriptional repressor of NAD biosynthesis genes